MVSPRNEIVQAHIDFKARDDPLNKGTEALWTLLNEQTKRYSRAETWPHFHIYLLPYTIAISKCVLLFCQYYMYINILYRQTKGEMRAKWHFLHPKICC